MSEYFRVLNRLSDEKNASPLAAPLAAPRRAEATLAPVVRRSPPEREPRAEASTSQPLPLLKANPTPVERRPAPFPGMFREILDALQHLRATGSTRCLVLASASHTEDAVVLASQVASCAAENGLRVEAVRLSMAVERTATRGGAEVEELCLDVARSDWRTRLATWQATMSSDSVAVLIAPPLASSSDAALIASGCDGLAVLVELGQTQSQALALAIKRARSMGCRLLGLIVTGSDGLPAWGRQLLQFTGEIHAKES